MLNINIKEIIQYWILNSKYQLFNTIELISSTNSKVPIFVFFFKTELSVLELTGDFLRMT